MASPPLRPEVFTILSGLVEERGGLHYRPEDRELFAEKIAPRVADRGFDSYLDYYYYLRYDPGGGEELDRLIESLVVHESFFFREPEPLRVLVDELLAPAVAAGAAPRVWCAAAANGEEPYTLAMLLDARGLLEAISLVATDVSGQALARLREGVYGPRSLRALPEGVLGRWLHPVGGGFAVDERLRRALDVRQLNLVDPEAIHGMGRFHAILCRNVLIYFGDQTTRRVTDALRDALLPDGWLLVGASESLLRLGTALRCEERGGAFLYRRAS